MGELAEIEILLVEDNPTDAELTMRALRRNNLANRLHWVKDGEEALEFLFRSGARAALAPPKLIMLDIKMPKVDGIEVLRRLKQDPARRTSYIVKPVQFDAFLETVARIVRVLLVDDAAIEKGKSA